MTEEILITKISPSRWQPRALVMDASELLELAQSIDELGLFNPVIVFQEEDNWYELVAGERRTRASLALAWARVDEGATLREAVDTLATYGLGGLPGQIEALINDTIEARIEDRSDMARLHRIAVMENIERASLTPIEEAHGLQSLIDEYGWSQRRLAQEIGKSQGYVAQRLALLDLPEEAQEAVNTRVLGLTHARALQGVPERIADEMAGRVIDRVKGGATTREVSQELKAVSQFLDQDRYRPQAGVVYSPEVRNRRLLLQWMTGDHTPDLKSLRKNKDVLNATANTLAKYRWRCNEVAQIFVFADLDDAWEAFSRADGRRCEHCRYEGHVRDWPYPNQNQAPCKRWTGPAMSCERFVGHDDPLVVTLGNYHLRTRLEDLGLSYDDGSFYRLKCETIEDFLAHYDAALNLQEEIDADNKQEADLGYLDDITEWQIWQGLLPDEALEHFQAHACTRCAHHRPGEVPACEYGQRPLPKHHFDGYRAPDFVVLVTRDGQMLPRCERFVCARLPEWPGTPGTSFSIAHRRKLLAICKQLVSEGRMRSDYGLWLPLQWLPYDRPHPADDGEWVASAALTDYLETLWMMTSNRLGEKIVDLLDALVTERNPSVNSRKNIIELSNPVRGEREQFVAVDWDYVNGERGWPAWKDWPESWPDKPWEEK